MERIWYGKRGLALLFIVLLGLMWSKSSSYTTLGKIYEYLKGQDRETELTLGGLETDFVDSFVQKEMFINLNGAMAKRLSIQGYYSSMGMYVTDDKYIVSSSAETSTDYEYEEVVAFKEYLDEKGINLIYINEPTKYMDDDIFLREFGLKSYSNKNADLFLKRISEAGVNTIDLREEIVQDGLDIRGMFYRTDHHWTTRSGLWAAGKIAEGLNTYCGYEIDTSIYDESNYSFMERKNCWLGEQGRKVAVSYVGLDDHTEIKPNFATSFTFKYGDGMVEGTFDNFVDESVYNSQEDMYHAPSWHYSYICPNVINNNVDYGKVLVLGDSYEYVMLPFLALGVSKIDWLIMRDYGGSLREYIDVGDYDTVLVCYAQFMIGAHDDPQSANYAMFSLNQ